MKIRSSLILFLIALFLGNIVTNSTYGKNNNNINYSTPFCFVENKGQIRDQYGNERSDIDFKLSSKGVNIFIGRGKILYQFAEPISPGSGIEGSGPIPYDMYRMEVNLLGYNERANLIRGLSNEYYEHHYGRFVPLDGVKSESFSKVVYEDIYPNVDWELHIKDGALKYDFIVRPGGRVSDIKLQIAGADEIMLEESGSWLARTPLGEIRESAPYSFQADGIVVNSRFVLKGNEISFQVDPYQGSLIIDPSLSWSTYYGGPGLGFTGTNVIGVEFKDGYLYASGVTMNPQNIATQGSFRDTMVYQDLFLAQLSASGKLLWGTYLGGTNPYPLGADLGGFLACDNSGNIYILGSSADTVGIGTAGTHQSINAAGTRPPGGGSTDAYLLKFNSTGQRIWGTYFGGPGIESIGVSSGNVICDKNDFVYIIGHTTSDTLISTTGSHQEQRIPNSIGDLGVTPFLAKFDPENGHLVWATYYGSNNSSGFFSGIAVDSYNNVYVAGGTTNNDHIATSGSYKDKMSSKDTGEAFLVKFNSEGKRIWGTYYGGRGNDRAINITTDNFGNILMTGATCSSEEISTPGSHQQYLNSSGSCERFGPHFEAGDLFLAKFDSSGNRIWATYWGGDSTEFNSYAGIICDQEGDVFMCGSTLSTDHISTNDAFQLNSNGSYDGFFARFSKEGILKYSTYYGGMGNDHLTDLTLDPLGNVYIGGTTWSAGLATPGSFLDTHKGGQYGLIAKFCFGNQHLPDDFLINLDGSDTLCLNSESIFTVHSNYRDEIDRFLWELPFEWELLSEKNDSMSIRTGDVSGWTDIKVKILRCGDTAATEYVKRVYVHPRSPANITVEGFELSTLGEYKSYQWLLEGEPIPGADKRSHKVQSNGDYQVITVNAYGCIDTSAIYGINNYPPNNIKTYNASWVRIYPNPTEGLLNIFSPYDLNISLVDLSGRLLGQWRNVDQISMEDLPQGMYFIRFMNDSGLVIDVRKIIRE